MNAFLFYLLQFTWGIIQNLAGFIAFLILAPTHKHERFNHAVITYVNAKGFGGLSMGMFIFMGTSKAEEWAHDTKIHEYGHSFQSILLGPLYLIVVGIPSSVWCNFPVFVRMRKEQGVSYYKLYCEGWANLWGRAAVKENFISKDMTEHGYFGKPLAPVDFNK